MVSPRKKSTNLHNKPFYYMLLIMWICNVRATEIQVQAEVGGNVSIYCPVNPQLETKYFYLQKPKPPGKDDFVNGFHSENDIPDNMKWNNTRLDPHNKTTVHMYNVTLEHAGVYKCHIDGIESATTVNLKVTAKYSKPEFMMMNVSTLGLCVMCKSYGGYPPAEFTWNVSGNEGWRVTTKNTEADKLTELVNASSTVYINCSGVERSVSCSVGDSESDTFQVCRPTPPGNGTVLIVSVCGVLGLLGVVVLLLVPLVVWIKRGRGHGRRGGDGSKSWDGGEGGDGGGQTQNSREMRALNSPGNGNA